jgi:hypothetical protein
MNGDPKENQDDFTTILKPLYSGALAIAVVAITELLGTDTGNLEQLLP